MVMNSTKEKFWLDYLSWRKGDLSNPQGASTPFLHFIYDFLILDSA